MGLWNFIPQAQPPHGQLSSSTPAGTPSAAAAAAATRSRLPPPPPPAALLFKTIAGGSYSACAQEQPGSRCGLQRFEEKGGSSNPRHALRPQACFTRQWVLSCPSGHVGLPTCACCELRVALVDARGGSIDACASTCTCPHGCGARSLHACATGAVH